jgi:hypothetical protein
MQQMRSQLRQDELLRASDAAVIVPHRGIRTVAVQNLDSRNGLYAYVRCP